MYRYFYLPKNMLCVKYRDRFGPVDSDANVGYTIYSTERDQRQA